LDEFENEAEIEIKTKLILRHANLEQVDGGEYGPEPPVHHPADTNFGSIDKSDKYSNYMGLHIHI